MEETDNAGKKPDRVISRILIAFVSSTQRNACADSHSVTRCGNILPLWWHFGSLWQSVAGLFSFGKKLANFWYFWANFHCFEWAKMGKYSNHLVTLLVKDILQEQQLKGSQYFHFSRRYVNVRRPFTRTSQIAKKQYLNYLFLN